MTSSPDLIAASPHPTHHHLAFGLHLVCPFPIHQLPHADASSPVALRIEFGAIPAELPDLRERNWNPMMEADVQLDHHGNLIWATARGRFWAKDGSHIIIEPRTAAAPTTYRQFVLYTCLPAILNQRGHLALHANALLGPQGAIVLMGRSGAGKSTLFAALLAHGLPMLADDITTLTFDIPFDTNSSPHVLPGYPTYRLCADTLERISPPTDRLRPLGGTRNKVLLQAPAAHRHSTPAPLHSIYLLTPHAGNELRVRRINGIRAFQQLQANCYSPAAALLPKVTFTNLNRVLQTCAIYTVERPRQQWTVEALRDRLLIDHQSVVQA